MKISFHTFGCKSNLYDTNQLASLILERKIFEISEHEIIADIHLINTCTVTSSSDSQARNLIRRINLKNDFSTVIITGCSVRRSFLDYEKLINSLNTKNNKFIVLKNIDNKSFLKIIEPLNLKENSSKNKKTMSSVFRTRAFVKITDGCNNFCSYCIIPFVRGNEKSRDILDIVGEVSKLESEGIKEVVITGINTGNYSMGIENLLEKLLELTSIPRIRISSLRPSKISNKLIEIMQNKRICPHLHVSLQSGSNKILKLMNRLDYNSKDFLDKLEEFYSKNKFRNPFIAADVIVGFPGEDEGDFEQTLTVLQKSKINKLHVFVFSPRPGTKAFDMKQGCSKENRRRRDVLLEFSKNRYFLSLENMIGKKAEILWEKNNTGRTENYYPVLGEGMPNTIQNDVFIKDLNKEKLQLLI
jgi:threonylcarbamoyladenosine tRNA methylthiotransferase MtaB